MDNQTRVDDFHHAKVTLYRWVIPLPLPPPPNREIEPVNPKAKGRETQCHFFKTTWSPTLFSFHTTMDTRIMEKLDCL